MKFSRDVIREHVHTLTVTWW